MIEYILLGFLALVLLMGFCLSGLFLCMLDKCNKYIKRKEYDQRYNQGERKGWKW